MLPATQTPAPPATAPGFWWRVLSPVGAVLAAFITLIVVAVVLLAFLSEDLAGAIALFVGGVAILGFAALLLGRLPRHEQRTALALKHSRIGAVLMGINVGLGLIIVSIGVLLLGFLVDPALQDRVEGQEMDLGSGAAAITLTVIALVVLAPLGEELMFRGLLLRGLARRMGFWKAALVSSAVFGCAHLDAWFTLNWARGLSLVLVGVGLAWLYRWRGYWAAVVAHGTVNTVAAVALLSQT